MFGTWPSWLMAEWMLTYRINVLQLQQQQNRLMKINHDLRHRITVVEAQGKALIEQKVELEAYLQTKEQEMGNLRAELGKLREKLQGEDSQDGEEVKVRCTLNHLLNSLLKSFTLHIKYLFGKCDWYMSEAMVGLEGQHVVFGCDIQRATSLIALWQERPHWGGWWPSGTDTFFLKEGTGLTEGRVAAQVSSGMSALENSSCLRLGYPSYILGSVTFGSCTRLQNLPDIRTNHCFKRECSIKTIMKQSKISGVSAVSLYWRQIIFW